MRVLYIAGSGRSGSTLLSNLLGQVDGFFAAGELRYLWSRGLVDDRLCGCGRPFSRCPVWTEVLECAYGGARYARAGDVLRWQAKSSRARHIPLLLASRPERDLLAPRLAGYRRWLGRLYGAINEVTGAEVLVDSSKLPAYGWALEGTAGVELAVVHLVRDPRAAAHSWRRAKPLTDGAQAPIMQQMPPLRSALLWDAQNLAAGALWRDTPQRYLRLRYEDLVAHPRAALEQVLELVGRSGATLPLVDDHSAALDATHTVAGNPDRLQRGPVTLRVDDRWRRQMPQRDKLIVSLATAPLLGRFGYPLAPGVGERLPAAAGRQA